MKLVLFLNDYIAQKRLIFALGSAEAEKDLRTLGKSSRILLLCEFKNQLLLDSMFQIINDVV